MTHEQILQHCIEMANKRRIAHLKANHYKGAAERLFRAKCNQELGIQYPNIENISNSVEELVSTYGDKECYWPDLKKVFKHNDTRREEETKTN